MYLTHIYPQPRELTEDYTRPYVFGAAVTLHVNHALAPLAAARVKTLWHRFSCTASSLTIVETAAESCGDWCGWIGAPGNACIRKPEDTYAIQVTEAGVQLCAKDEAAFLDGIKTLVQLICPDELEEGRERLYMASAEIHDSPLMGIRSVHFCILPDYPYEVIEKSIHLAGLLKYTHVILEFWGTLRLRCFPELGWKDRSMTMDQAKNLVNVARSYGMEVIPMLNHIGHAPGSRGRYGRHVVLDTNPRLARLFEPDGWTWCISNPETYRRLAEVREELCALCGPGSYFHLGGDEADSIGACDRCRGRETYELFAEYVNRVNEDLAKMGRRPFLWHDMLINRGQFECPDFYDANGQIKNTGPAIDLLDKRIIIADWEYNLVSGVNPTTPYFRDKGFDVICCSFNNVKNIQCLTEDVQKFGAMGLMVTTWHLLYQTIPVFKEAGDLMWRGRSNPRLIDDTSTLLRTVYDARGEYYRAGWGKQELESL